MGERALNRTLRNILYFLCAVLFVRSLGSVRVFFVAKILQPTDYGVWVTLILIISFSPIVALGTAETLLKEYPFFKGKGDLKRAQNVEEVVFSSIALSGLFLLFLGFLMVFIPVFGFETDLNFMVYTMIFSSAISLFSAFFYNRFAAYQNFKMVGISDGIRAGITFVILVYFAYMWRLKGVVIGWFLSEVLICSVFAVLSFRINGAVRFDFNRSEIFRVIRVGFPITLIWWVFILQTATDRIFSMSMLGKTSTGYYGLGVNIYTAMILIPVVVARVLYPRINEELGKGGSSSDNVISLTVEPTRILTMAVALAIGACIVISPIIYVQLFPKFLPGLASAQILIVGAYFISMVRNGANYLISSNRQNMVLRFLFFSLVVNVAGNVIFIKMGLDIMGVALATSISGALLSILIWFATFRCLGYSISRAAGETTLLYGPLFITGLLLALLQVMAHGIYDHPLNGTWYYMAGLTLVTMITFRIVPPYSAWTSSTIVGLKENFSRKPRG